MFWPKLKFEPRQRWNLTFSRILFKCLCFSYKSLTEMAIAIFTTTSPVFWDPSQWCLSSTTIISFKIFLAMPQNLLNFVFFVLFTLKSLSKDLSEFFMITLIHSLYSACLLFSGSLLLPVISRQINWNWAGDILFNMTCSVNLCPFSLCEWKKYCGKFYVTFSTVEFWFVKWSTEVGPLSQTKYLLPMAHL